MLLIVDFVKRLKEDLRFQWWEMDCCLTCLTTVSNKWSRTLVLCHHSSFLSSSLSCFVEWQQLWFSPAQRVVFTASGNYTMSTIDEELECWIQLSFIVSRTEGLNFLLKAKVLFMCLSIGWNHLLNGFALNSQISRMQYPCYIRMKLRFTTRTGVIGNLWSYLLASAGTNWVSSPTMLWDIKSNKLLSQWICPLKQQYFSSYSVSLT